MTSRKHRHRLSQQLTMLAKSPFALKVPAQVLTTQMKSVGKQWRLGGHSNPKSFKNLKPVVLVGVVTELKTASGEQIRPQLRTPNPSGFRQCQAEKIYDDGGLTRGFDGSCYGRFLKDAVETVDKSKCSEKRALVIGRLPLPPEQKIQSNYRQELGVTPIQTKWTPVQFEAFTPLPL